MCTFKFLVIYFVTTVFGEGRSGLANLSRALKEGYGLKVKQQHKQMTYGGKVRAKDVRIRTCWLVKKKKRLH